MPNHVTNRLKVVGSKEQIKTVWEDVQVEKENEGDKIYGIGTIDFNKITPMPRWVYGSNPKVVGINQKDEEKYGRENTVLAWATENWGTKWGAYEQPSRRNTEDTIYFETAWNGVPDLIQKLAWLHPDVILEYSYADEDFANNVGEYHFRDTEIIYKNVPIGSSKEAFELAADIRGGMPEWYAYNAELDNYEYVETEE